MEHHDPEPGSDEVSSEASRSGRRRALRWAVGLAVGLVVVVIALVVVAVATHPGRPLAHYAAIATDLRNVAIDLGAHHSTHDTYVGAEVDESLLDDNTQITVVRLTDDTYCIEGFSPMIDPEGEVDVEAGARVVATQHIVAGGTPEDGPCPSG